MKNLVEKVHQYILQYHMFELGDRVLIGVSGGADSICLLSVLQRLSTDLSITLSVFHMNHGLRGAEADADEAFVKAYCKAQRISCHSVKKDVSAIAKENSWSVEEAGRNLRYSEMEREANRLSCSKIAIAHHQNDIAETVMFHMFRGTGLSGLCGIWPVRGRLVRPLLEVSRQEIECYLSEQRINYRTDSSNESDHYSRNKIRNYILPYAEEEINQKAVRHIAELASQMRELKEFVESMVNHLWDSLVEEAETFAIVNKKGYSALAPFLKKEFLLRLLENIGKNGILNEKGGRKNIGIKQLQAIDELMGGRTSSRIQLPNGIIAERVYEGIKFYSVCLKSPESVNELHIAPEGLPGGIALPMPDETPFAGYILFLSLIEYNKSIQIPKNRYTNWYDYDKIENMLKFRVRKGGDILQLDKNGTHKKLNRLLIDQKVPQEARDRLLVLAAGCDILLVPGIRSGQKWLVTDETKRVLTAELLREDSAALSKWREKRCKDNGGESECYDTGGKSK